MAQQLIRFAGVSMGGQSVSRANYWSIPRSVQVTDTATVLITENPDRTGLTIINDNPSRLYIRCGLLDSSPVSISSFDRIIPGYSTLTFEAHEVPTTEISALATGEISGNWIISESAASPPNDWWS